MKLADTNYDNTETGCCARLDVAKWNEREMAWHDRLFLKDHVRAVMHIPLNMGSVMARDQKAIEDAAAYPEDPLWLSDEVSPWGMDAYVSAKGYETKRHLFFYATCPNCAKHFGKNQVVLFSQVA